MTGALYAQPRQSIERDPTVWENEFADVLEAAFASGVRDLEPLVEALNASRVRPRDGGAWTAERFAVIVAELGAA